MPFLLLQVKMWKELEEQRGREELDPAKEAGSVILELAGSDAGVQRLRALGAQVRAKFGQPSASEEDAQEGPSEQLKEAESSAGEDKAPDPTSLNDNIGMQVFMFIQRIDAWDSHPTLHKHICHLACVQRPSSNAPSSQSTIYTVKGARPSKHDVLRWCCTCVTVSDQVPHVGSTAP